MDRDFMNDDFDDFNRDFEEMTKGMGDMVKSTTRSFGVVALAAIVANLIVWGSLIFLVFWLLNFYGVI